MQNTGEKEIKSLKFIRGCTAAHVVAETSFAFLSIDWSVTDSMDLSNTNSGKVLEEIISLQFYIVCLVMASIKSVCTLHLEV